MVIYIHGFGSSGLGMKSKLFREYFQGKGVDFIAPSLSYIPDLAIQTLEELIESYEDVTLIGSSLGGYYSIYLSQKYNLKAVLINPSTKPYITLNKCTEYAPSFYDSSDFKWMDEHIQALKKYDTQHSAQENLLLLTQKGDETLDYKEAVKMLPNSVQHIEEGGNHSFENIDDYFARVFKFLL